MPAHNTANTTTEAELIASASVGDADAFTAIMRRHNQLLFRTARSILKTDQDAEDALQEAYLHAWQSLAGFRSDAKLSTWLTRIVINEALGRLRRKSADLIPLEAAMTIPDLEIQNALTASPKDAPDRQAYRSQLRTILESQIDLLPDTFRTVFVLRAIEEMDAHDIGLALGIPETTVRTRYFRARGILRERLATDVDLAMMDAFSFDGQRCDRIVARVLERADTLTFSR